MTTKTNRSFAPLSQYDVVAATAPVTTPALERAERYVAELERSAALEAEIRGLRAELADAEGTLVAVEAWRQAEMQKAADVEDLSDDPYQEGWATGVDEAMVALGDVLGTCSCCIEVAEEAAL